MASEEDWLFRPVLRGMCQYESLKSGLLTLYDLTKLNEAIDVEIENQNRMHRG